MFLTLACGVALWIVYGLLKADYVIVISNGVSLGLLAIILYVKIRERPGEDLMRQVPVLYPQNTSAREP
jgi:MtN3 and saliva related transmembrane protein